MRIIFIVLFAVTFVGAPLYALNALVMPQLQSLQQVYANEGAVANNIARASH